MQVSLGLIRLIPLPVYGWPWWAQGAFVRPLLGIGREVGAEMGCELSEGSVWLSSTLAAIVRNVMRCGRWIRSVPMSRWFFLARCERTGWVYCARVRVGS